ncbi:MAG: TetR/AcrR family transcriptional regulator [Lachnospiraceae bacterium]|nr:TetR/AcrR family transcriptional regulator [Lachnospiraceae bacterium]
MNNNFVNRKDRIIASALEIISEAGLASLTTKTLAMKENMSESLLYRYFGGIEEVLVEVVDNFTKFDNSIIATIEAKDISHLDKVLELLKTFSTYYSGYKEIAAVVLNYEEFLHNVNTRETIATCIAVRTNFIRKEIEAAIREREIVDIFTPEELADIFMGSLDRDLLNRRIQNDNKTHIQVVASIVDKLADMLRIREDS